MREGEVRVCDSLLPPVIGFPYNSPRRMGQKKSPSLS